MKIQIQMYKMAGMALVFFIIWPHYGSLLLSYNLFAIFLLVLAGDNLLGNCSANVSSEREDVFHTQTHTHTQAHPPQVKSPDPHPR